MSQFDSDKMMEVKGLYKCNHILAILSLSYIVFSVTAVVVRGAGNYTKSRIIKRNLVFLSHTEIRLSYLPHGVLSKESDKMRNL